MLILTMLWAVNCSERENNGDALFEGFLNPPSSSKPRVWWHWMNGNITKEGIKKDLEWMHSIGIGGFQNFDASLATPQIVKNRLTYMTLEWREAFRFTTNLADSLGLEMAIAGSPGWSESGGPWVAAKDGMKKYVWTETLLEGGIFFKGNIPQPPSTTGTFQNASTPHNSLTLSPGLPEPPEYYKDVAVIAYKLPEADIAFSEVKPRVTSSKGIFTLAQLTDGDVATSSYLPPKKVGEYAWVQYEFDKPIVIKSLTIAGGGLKEQFSLWPEEVTRNLEISNDGKNFTKAMDLPLGRVVQKTFTFSPITARYFRFNFLTQAPKPNMIQAMMGLPVDPLQVKGTEIAEINLSAVHRINAFEAKAAFEIATDLYEHPTPDALDPISAKDVIDLTGKMKSDGSLEWDAPAGRWVILRFGYSLTGRQNHPASPEATGLEVDKLDSGAVKSYIENYLDQYKDATGGLMGKKGLQYIITDSWEAETQNWTDAMMHEFQKRRGYSMVPWMPVLTGKIVTSSEASDKFLWDFRQTLSEMVKEYHYDVLTEVLHARGMGRYTESHEYGRALIGDGMAIKSKADIPMSAMWTAGALGGSESDGPAISFQADIRESASVAHLYGQNLVAAESMTTIGNTWAFSPERLKQTADMELASGLNRFVIHTSVHQPVDDKIPGLGLGPFGQWFTRHETWAEQAGSWVTYLARSSYILQQGKFVADILYYYGEDSNVTALFGVKLPDIAEGYSYDFINKDAVVDLLSVENGKIVTPGRMSYQVLVLDKNSRYMSLKVLKKIHGLVKSGAVIVGSKPAGTPSLSDDKNEFDSIVKEVWSGQNSNVYSDQPLDEVLASLKISPDFQYTKPAKDSELRFVHRKMDNVEFYWVNNRRNRFEETEATFRVSGKAVEIWHPDTGKREKATYKMDNGVTTVQLNFEPNDAFFVAFTEKTSEKEFTAPPKTEKQLATLDADWSVRFQPGRGAPERITMDTLISWTAHSEPGVKYFSGTASYSTSLKINESWLKSNTELWIDLGGVKNLAEVIVNGKSLGVLWKAPFRTEITNALKPGENKLEIKVTNLWVNRLIGDQQPDVVQRITYTTMPFYKKDSPLLPSGLMGPVRVLSINH